MDSTQTSNVRTASTVGILAGLWLIISPFILGNSGVSTVMWNEIIFGVIVAVLAGIQMASTETRWPSWINFVVGLWLILAPFVLNSYTGLGAARSNDVVLGIIVGLTGLWAALATPEVQHR